VAWRAVKLTFGDNSRGHWERHARYKHKKSKTSIQQETTGHRKI
jgi:hypothetical protein